MAAACRSRAIGCVIQSFLEISGWNAGIAKIGSNHEDGDDDVVGNKSDEDCDLYDEFVQ